MRKVLFIILFFMLMPNVSYAAKHELEDLHIHTYINGDGSATITETRQATLSEGTENFLVIENIGKSEITDFQVTEYGLPYDFVDDWDIIDSHEEKAFTYGMIYTKDGYELVWGIGEYGTHE